MLNNDVFYATGKRKKAVAKTWIKLGSGKIDINGRTIDEYFSIENVKAVLKQPLIITDNIDTFDIKIKINGGGSSGQAGAIRHGITKALIQYNSEYRTILKKAGFVTRDSRVKERKKYGQKGARARFQFSKR